MQGVETVWKSKMCACCGFIRLADSFVSLVPCDSEHAIWCWHVGLEELPKKLRELKKAIDRGVSSTFDHIVERYSKSDPTFHRPKPVAFSDDAPTPELALYLIESMGAVITACTNPRRLATLLAGKASQGLSEKMWLKDWWGSGSDPLAYRTVLPEEYVVSGDLDVKAAEAMFRPLIGELLWLVGWDENFT